MAWSRDRERRGRHTDLLVHTPICFVHTLGPASVLPFVTVGCAGWCVRGRAIHGGQAQRGSTARHEIERGPGSPGPRGVALGCGRGGGRCGWLWLRARLAVAVWPVPAGAAGPGEPGPCTASASATPAVGRVAGRTADHAARRAAGPRRTWATRRAPDARRDDRPPGLGALHAGEPAPRAARRVGARAGGNRSGLPGVSWWEGLFPAGSRPAPPGPGPVTLRPSRCREPAGWPRPGGVGERWRAGCGPRRRRGISGGWRRAARLPRRREDVNKARRAARTARHPVTPRPCRCCSYAR